MIIPFIKNNSTMQKERMEPKNWNIPDPDVKVTVISSGEDEHGEYVDFKVEPKSD